MLKVTANNQQIAAHINAAAEQYLVRHREPGFFKTHTRQGEAQMVLQSVQTFLKHTISAKVLIEDIYKNHIQGQHGELSDALAVALNNCVSQDAFHEIQNELAAASGVTGMRYADAFVARVMFDKYYPLEVEKTCVVQ